MKNAGTALPWVNEAAFARRAIEVSMPIWRLWRMADWTFFDRGLVDALVALAAPYRPIAAGRSRDASSLPRQVFLAPPWPRFT